MRKWGIGVMLVLMLVFGISSPIFAQQTATQQLTIVVNAAPITFMSPTTLPYGITTLPYSQTVTATGGQGALTFSISAGTLPAGLTLSPAGVISGTPTTVGAGTSFTVKATDSVGTFSTQTYSAGIQIVTKLTITTSTLPAAPIGVAYSGVVNFTGGVGPYTCALSTGTLPTGLTLALSGNSCTITGTPTAAGSSTFTVQVGSAQ